MTWIHYALISLFVFSGYDLLSRYLATRSANPRAFSAIYNGLVALMSPALFLIDSVRPSNLTFWNIALAIVGVVVWGLFARFEFYAHTNVKASTLTIVLKLAPFLNFVLAILLLREPLTVSKIIGLGLIVIANAILFLNQQRKTIISDTGLKYAIIVAILLAVAWLLDSINVKSWGIATYGLISYLGGAIICGLFPQITLDQIKQEFRLTPFWHILTLSITNLVGYSSMLKALSIGPASNVMPVVTATPALVVLFGFLFLGEKDHLARKSLATICILVAIYFLR